MHPTQLLKTPGAARILSACFLLTISPALSQTSQTYQALVQVRVTPLDSADWPNLNRYEVIALDTIDTRIFEGLEDAGYNADWLGLTFRDSAVYHPLEGGSNWYIDPDSVETVFLAWAEESGGLGPRYFMSSRVSVYLKAEDENQPFPLLEALEGIEEYYTEVRLGPVFSENGIISDLTTAEPDGDSWIVENWHGSGDCPSGCTVNDYTTYTIRYDGNSLSVCREQRLDTEHPTQFPPTYSCNGTSPIIRPPHARAAWETLSPELYRADGRRVPAGGTEMPPVLRRPVPVE